MLLLLCPNVKFVVANGGHAALRAFRHFHGGFSLRTAFYKAAQGTTTFWFRQKYRLLLILSRSTSAALLFAVMALSSMKLPTLFIELSTFALRFRFRFAPCPLLRFLQRRPVATAEGQHYGQQSFRNLQSCHSHRFFVLYGFARNLSSGNAVHYC